MTSVTIRPLQSSDIPDIVSYWANATPEELDRMGADPSKIPNVDDFAQNLRQLLVPPSRETKTFYVVWTVNGSRIGFSSLKNIRFGECGEIHLHIWNREMRFQGFGKELFCLSVVYFFETFQLNQMRCEPRASNPYPNRMLQKIGFRFLGSRIAASSELSLICELNEYEIQKDVASDFLRDSKTSRKP